MTNLSLILQIYAVNELVFFLVFKKVLNLSWFMKFVYKIKQTRTNLHKYHHPSSLTQLIYAHICTMPRAKKGQQKVPTLKKTTGLYPSRCYYSMIHNRDFICVFSPGRVRRGEGRVRTGRTGPRMAATTSQTLRSSPYQG